MWATACFSDGSVYLSVKGVMTDLCVCVHACMRACVHACVESVYLSVKGVMTSLSVQPRNSFW